MPRSPVLMLEAFFSAKFASVDIGAGILAMLAWLACCLGFRVVRELYGCIIVF